MSETIRENSIQKDLIREDFIQNVDQSVEKDDQLSTFEKSSQYDTHYITDHQFESKTSDILQTDLKKSRHQEIDNSHTDMKTPLSFDRRQGMSNLHTGMRGPQSFGRQQSPQFRTSQSFQSAISTTSREIFSLSREERSLFESSRSFNELIRSLINSIEPRSHSTDDVSRMEIHSSSSRNLMDQIDEISTEQISLKIIDIFERLNIADKIEKVKKIVKEKGKAKDQKDQFKSSKPSSSRSIESSDLDPANIIEGKRNRKSNLKYAQLVYEE